MTTTDGLVPDTAAVQGSLDLLETGSTLFSIAGASDGTTQWRVEALQIVNWGGFHGETTLRFSPASTLLSGASGSGKSTLLDAYTALMMPSDVPFNGASNDTAGRARGSEQRSLVSYLRGQTDITSTVDGEERPQVLRGDAGPTWGAVAATFISDQGRAFTAARVYLVPANARLGGDVQQRMLTVDGRLDLRDLEPFAADGFVPQKLRARFGGLNSHDSYQSFAARLFTRLGIGANGDGDKALRLLSRVQAGHQIRTVDALYKEMVLEQPATYTAADQALAHFDSLADTYRQMQQEYLKLQLLEPITGAWQRLTAARDSIAQLDSFGLHRAGDSPLTVWAAEREATMVEDAIAANRDGHRDLATAARAAFEHHQRLDGRLEDARAEHARAGGADLLVLAARIEEAEAAASERQLALDELTSRLAAILDARDVDLGDRQQFDALVSEGAKFDASFQDRVSALESAKSRLDADRYPLLQRQREIVTELKRLEKSTSRIPAELDRLRGQVCDATGMRPDELPFIAELVAVSADHAEWTTAIETVLGGPARLMLVPSARLEEFSSAINDLRLRGRLRFTGATPGLPLERTQDDRTVAGKLEHKDGPFQGWVSSYLAEPARNALCVSGPAELAGREQRVTITGQIRRGTTGAHGRGDSRNILGFTNEDIVDDLEREHRDLIDQLDAIDAQYRREARDLDSLRSRHTAYSVLSGAVFAQVDVREVAARVVDLTERREGVLASNDQLAELDARIQLLKRDLAEAWPQVVRTRDAVDASDKRWGELVESKDRLTARVDALQGADEPLMSDAHRQHLEHRFRSALGEGGTDDLTTWPANLNALRNVLMADHASAVTEVDRSSAELVRTFAQFLDRFDNPNLTASVEAYPDFARILSEVQSVGLPDRRAAWRERLVQWSGQDLVPLAQAMQSSIDDIRDRLAPINDILSRLPFGATRDRLHMRMRVLRRDSVTRFRQQLARLSAVSTTGLGDDQLEPRFKELEAFMARLRSSRDVRYDAKISQRDEVLDVRRHVEVLAERRPVGGERVLSTYTSLGSKSGGETQELIAFIVGAALRFRLGDEDRARPRFAPVCLDEGFIKADAEFASRAVQAWLGLGFQLIVGAPLDKVAALEPHMDSFALVTKNQRTNYSRIRHISAADRADPSVRS